ncbi:AAA family ATPase [Pseudobacillus sp. 179-B 2D1 NHS]|uniref:AAA family ATPase n=1 Tax=Pseudobacillus sp. 179-B 2D1 NHS TaxID=3374292 RepID=UPI00387987D4
MDNFQLERYILRDNYLDILLKRYLKFRTNPEYDEKYKWDILDELNRYLQKTEITEETVLDVIKYIKSKNPQTGSFTHWSSLDNLTKLAEEAPGLTAKLFKILYDESLPVRERIEQFHFSGKEHGKNLGAPLFGYLLAAYDYKKYPLYKEELLKEMKKAFGIDKKLGTISENYQLFFDICRVTHDYTRDQGHDFNFLDVQDMFFCATYYYTMIAETAVEYLHSLAVKLQKFMENDELFLSEIKKMDLPFLEERRKFYQKSDKINRIRYLMLEQWLNKKTLSLEDLERMKQEVNEEYESNILHSWNNFRIMFQIYYTPMKDRVLYHLGNLHYCIREMEEFSDTAFVQDKALNGFSWNQNFGGSECWIALYPNDIENHKKAAQLFVKIDGEKVSYGLGYGSEHPKRNADWLLETVTDMEDFTYEKLHSHLVDVYPQFLEDNQWMEAKADTESSVDSTIRVKREPKYFWLTTNPSIWTVDEIKEGGEVFYTAFNEKGNKRRIYHSFETAKPGDRVLFYESTPRKEIVAEGEVTKDLHTGSSPGFPDPVEGVSFRYVRNMAPIAWEQLNQVDDIKQSTPIKNGAQGSLFELTKEQFETILSMEQPELMENHLPIPSIDFSQDITMKGLFFEDKERIIKQVKTTLSKGKHIILTGPPGTGKSKMAKEICQSFGADYLMMTATSDWSAYDTIGGIRPNADGTLSFKQGFFLNCFKDEKTLKPENKWLIIDEMNRADIDKAFGALFSALTGDSITLNFQGESGNQIVVRPQKDVKEVLPNDYDFIIPNDWRLIGTINTIDKASLYEMSYAFMRRFAFIPVGVPKEIDEELVNAYLPLWRIEDYAYSTTLADIWRFINEYRQIGPAIIEDIAQFTAEDGDFTSAIVLYVLPQFEGLQESDILTFIKKLGELKNLDTNYLMEFAIDFFNIKE